MEDKFINEANKQGLKAKVRHFFAHQFFRNPLVHWTLIAAAFLNVANWIFLAIFIHPVDYELILHYNVYFGIDITRPWWEAYYIPAVGSIFLLVNISLAYYFYLQKERIASYLLLLTSIMVEAGLIIASAAVVIINH